MATSIAAPSLSSLLINTWANVYSSAPVAGFSGTVRVVVEVGSGNVKLSNTGTGITAATGYGDLYNGTAQSIAFEGTLTQVNAALQSLQAYNSDANASPTLKISAVRGGPAYNPANGHYYEVITSGSLIDWISAKSAAESRTFNGLPGYLATITSAAENQFIDEKINANAWIGATDSNNVSNRFEGNFGWATGPETNATIGTKYPGETVFTPIPGRYNNFAAGEPNNGNVANGEEGQDWVQVYADGTWDDNYLNNNVYSYIVEYGGYANDNPTEVARSTSSTLTVIATPVITSNGGGATATISYAENGTAAVTTVTATDADSGDTKTYSIAGGSGASSFDMNSATGVLTFKTAPNYEVPSDNGTNNSYEVKVRVTDGAGLFDEQTLTVNVTDVNDHAPIFTSGSTGTVAENAATSTVIYGAATTDADSTVGNRAVTYSLKGDGSADDAELLNISSTTGEVTLKASANCEAKNSYAFTVVATNAGTGATLVTEQAVTVSVNDVNEAATALELSANGIAENVATTGGIKIGDITITDPDASGNANVLTLDGTDKGLFEIRTVDSVSSLYYLGTSPDFETKSSYSVTLTATDGSLVYSQTFTINVTDINDHAPVFTSGSTGTVAENAATTTVIYDAATTDADGTETNRNAAYSLKTGQGDDADLLNINSTTGEVTLKTSANYEVKNSYAFTVVATNAGTGATLDTEHAVTVSVTDENEAATALGLSATSIAENVETTGGIKIGDISITDPDASGNSNSLSVAGDDAASFEMRNGTELFFKGASPDFETKSSYSVTLTATDGSLVYSQAFTINVTDVNEAPVISSNGGGETAVISYAENGTTAVTTVTATDPDSGDRKIFSISAGEDADLFRINASTGALNFKNSPNYEVPADADNNNSYTVTVKVADAAGLTDEQTLTVNVTDDTSANDPIETGGTDPVTIDHPVDNAKINVTGSGTTTITNPAGNLTIVHSGSGTVVVQGLNDGATVNTSGTGATKIDDPEGSLTVANSGTGTVTVDGLNTGAVLTTTGTGPTAVANPDGNLSVANNGTGMVTVNGLNPDASLSASGSGPTWVNDPEGSLTVANNGTGTVTVDGLNTGSVLTTSGTGPTAVTNPDGNLSVANNGTGTVTVNGLNPSASLSASGSGSTLVNDPEGSLTVANSGSGTVTVDGLNTGAVLTTTGTGPTAVTHPDGNLSVANNGTGTLTVNGLNSGASLNASGSGPTWVNNPEGNLTVSNSGSGTVTVAGLNDDAVLSSNSTGPIRVTDPDDDVHVVNSGTGAVSVEGMNAGAILSSSGTGPVTITHPDGNLRVANTGTGTVTVADLKPGATLTTTGTKPILVDLSHLSSGQTITIDNDGSGVVNLVNVPEGVIVLTTGSNGSGGINYAPTITDVPGAAQAVTAGTAAALADFKVADKDASQMLTVTLKATNGTVDGLTDADSTTPGIQLSGTADAINTALAGATFTAAGAGAASIAISVTDGVMASAATAMYSLTSTISGGDGEPPPPPPPPAPDNDDDGVDAGEEDSVPGTPLKDGGPVMAGDGNGDGIKDSTQAEVTSLNFRQTDRVSSNPQAPKTPVTLVADSKEGQIDPDVGTAQITSIGQKDAPANLPEGLSAPLGLLSFTAKIDTAGATETFSFYLDGALDIDGYYKQDASGTWVNLASAAYGGKVVRENGKLRLDFVIEDGGAFDSDGKANGIITDPGAPGKMALVPPPPPALVDSDHDQFPDALEAAHGLSVGTKDNDVFASTKFYAMQLYRDTLFREAEGAGLTYWQEVLDSGAQSRVQVANAFLGSPEFQAHAGALARLYFAAFDRIPDEAGMTHWMEKMLNQGQSLAQVAQDFADSSEFQRQYGALDNAGFLDTLYQNVMGRSPDEPGKAYWLGQLAGGTTRGEVLAGFAQSGEYQGLMREEVSVTVLYAGLLGRTPEQSGYAYWLDVLNSQGDVLEPIGAFVQSQEYHDRFLPAQEVGAAALVGLASTPTPALLHDGIG